MNDLSCVVSKDAKSEGVANIMCKSNESTALFIGRRWKCCVVNGKVYTFKQVELEEGTDIRCRSCQCLHWNFPCGWVNSVVKEITNVDHCMQPQVRGSVGTIHNTISPLFDCLVTSFCRVLMLMMRLALPVGDAKVAQYVLDFVAQLTFGVIRQEFGRCTLMSDLIL